jgi:hypothetical protein
LSVLATLLGCYESRSPEPRRSNDAGDAGDPISPGHDAAVIHGCAIGDRIECDCNTSDRGFRFCQPDSRDYGACTCLSRIWPEISEQQEPEPGCSPEREICDQRDNDCDGRVDERYVCPDDGLSFSDAFPDSVYFIGAVRLGGCTGGPILQPIWPEWSSIAYTGFPCLASDFFFTPSDGTLYFYDHPRRLVRDGPGNDDEPVRHPYDVQVPSRHALVGVLEDGRFVTAAYGHPGDDYFVFDASGHELARLNPQGDFEGRLSLLLHAWTISGNRAYVAYRREWSAPDRHFEILVFRLSEHSQWDLARRVAVKQPFCLIVLADGTVICPGESSQLDLVARLPDGTVHQLMPTLTSAGIRRGFDFRAIIGPREPKGPSAGRWTAAPW